MECFISVSNSQTAISFKGIVGLAVILYMIIQRAYYKYQRDGTLERA